MGEIFQKYRITNLFAAALIVLIVEPLTWARWLAAFNAGIIWLVVWYAPIWF